MILTWFLISQASFARAYGGSDQDWANSLALTADGGFVVVGSSWGFGSVWVDLLVLRLSRSGTMEWAKTYRGNGPEWASSVFQTPDRGYAIAGRTTSFGAQFSDFLILKMSSAGSVEWARMIGGPDYEMMGGATGCVDSGYAFTGGSYRGPEGWDLITMKLSRAGELEWARALDAGGLDFGEKIVQAGDGGFVVAGWTLSWGAGCSDFLVARFSPTGDPEWVKAYGGPEHDAAKSVALAPDGGFLVIGETWSFGSGTSDILLLKISPDGGLEWARAYGGLGIDLAGSVVVTPDGACMIAGQTLGFGAGDWDILAMKTGPTGDLDWAFTFGGPNPDTLGQVILSADSGFAIVGSTASWGAGQSEILVLRLPPDGSYPGCVEPCFLTVVDAVPSVSSPALIGGTCSFAISEVSPLVNPCAPEEMEICPPVVNESAGKGSGQGIICSPVPGAALFISPGPMPISIYAADGRLVHWGELREGENRIVLDRGVYLWRAEPYRGKALVR